MPAPRKLSELEGVCLGIVRTRDPCTAYKVRQELKEAPSSHWRASSGSVYPLLSRFEVEGLITTTSDEDDGRGRKLMSITRKGRSALKQWLLAGADDELISSVTDPVRSRMFFLGTLSSAQQEDYINRLIAQMQNYLAETRERLGDAQDDLYDYLGALGAIRITEARLAWLQEVSQAVQRNQGA